MNHQELHVIFGTGPLGSATMRELVARGKSIRMVNRSGKAPQGAPANIQMIAADAMNADAVLQAAQGASVIYNCVNAPYHEWQEKFPPLNTNILNAAIQTKAKLIVAENMYMYGDTNGKPITEDLPYNEHTRKGRVRAAMAREILDAQKAGKVRAAIARASDFYGPGVIGSLYGDRMFAFAVAGKPADVPGSADQPHTATYIGDFGKALAILGERDEALGQVWHVPSDKPLTQGEFVKLIFAELGQPPKMRVVGKLMMQIVGVFIPGARESVELMYEFEKPFVVDSSKFVRAFGDIATPTREGIQRTVEWYKKDLAGF